MKTSVHYSILLAVALAAGCASEPKAKPVHEQGWMGGHYKCAQTRLTKCERFFGVSHIIEAFPPALANVVSAGILAISVDTNTPAYQGGLRAGDLILEVAHQPVTNLPVFWRTVRATPAGTAVPVKLYRAGKTTECEVVVGREKYTEEGTVTIGLPGFWQGFHPIPTPAAPNFSLMALGWRRELDQSAELDSVEDRFKVSCNPQFKPEGYDGEWKCWLAILEISKAQKITAQETVALQSAKGAAGKNGETSNTQH